MNISKRIDRVAAAMALSAALFSAPALAVVEQMVEFPDARSIQSATLTLDGTDTVIQGEVREEKDRKIVVFVLPDGSSGKLATMDATVDGEKRSFFFPIGEQTPVFSRSDGLRPEPPAEGQWLFGVGVQASRVASDFAVRIADQSAWDAESFLTGQGVTNIVGGGAADDSASAWDGMAFVGYQFRDDSRLSLEFRTGATDDFGLNVDVSGDIPGTPSVATARSAGTAEIDSWSVGVNYFRYFTARSDFGFSLSLGHRSIERKSGFTSTLLVDGEPVDSFSGSETLDDDVLQYGIGVEWAPRNRRGNWAPAVGLRYTRSGEVGVLDDERIDSAELYLAVGWTVSRRLPLFD